MTGGEIVFGEAEQILCDGWPVELLVYDEPWSIVRDRAGTYRALTRTLRMAPGGALGRPRAFPGRGLAAQGASASAARAVPDTDVPDPYSDPTIVFAFRKDHPPMEADR